MNKKQTTIIAVIIIVLVFIGLYVAVNKTEIPANTNDTNGDTTPDTYTNTNLPVATTKTFVDANNTFSFDYPIDQTVMVGTQTGWRINSSSAGQELARLTIPKSFEPSTNLSDSRFTVGRSNVKSAVADCIVATNGEVANSVTAIGFQIFNVFQFGDAGAGNYYDTTSYRIVKDNYCYAIEYTIHSTNLSAYPADAGVTQFNKAKIQAVLEGVAKSFKFLAPTN